MAKLLQDREEFDHFCLLMKNAFADSYLEIGSWSGESIRLAASVLPSGSRIVSVDKPFKKTKEMYLRQAMQDLRRAGHDTHLFLGDSADPSIIAAVRKLGPFDVVFIDGDHTVPMVKSD